MTDATLSETDRLFENAPCGLFSMSSEGLILRANRTFTDALGADRDALTGVPFTSLLDPDSLPLYEAQFLPALREAGEVREFALALRRADGERRAVLMSATLVAGGEATVIDVAVFDSAQRQEYERQLAAARREVEASEARTRSLEAASAAFARCETPEELAHVLAESFKGAFGAEEVAVHLAHDGGLRLAGGSQPFEVPELAERMRIPGTLLRIGIDDSASDPEVVAALQAAHREELTLTPLLEGDQVAGTVSCFFDQARGADPAAPELHDALARQAVQVLRRIRLQQQLEAVALYDPLTGVANRTLLRTRLTAALAASERDGRPLAVLFVDLDGFKEINDLFDHSAGDDVLTLIARRLTAAVRPTDLVGRFGGDEFLVVCENTDAEGAGLVAERLRQTVKQPLAGIADERTITASIGVAVHRPAGADPLTPLEVFRVSDAAMYEAKKSGKDRVVFASV